MENLTTEINCIEIGVDTSWADYGELVKYVDYTSNKNYIGHDKDLNVPIYLNTKLKKGEIKKIMNTEFKDLEVGNYKAKVLQVYTKQGKEPNKELQLVEMEVNGDKQYLTFFMKGYNDAQMEISKKKIQDILTNFSIITLSELEGKEVDLVSRKNDKGYTNLYIYPVKHSMEWSCDCELPCVIKKIRATKNNSYVVEVEINFNGQKFQDSVYYNMENQYGLQNFNTLCSKINFNKEVDCGKELNKQAKFVVKKVPSKKDPNIIYTNKRIKFEDKTFKTSIYKIHRPNNI